MPRRARRRGGGVFKATGRHCQLMAAGHSPLPRALVRRTARNGACAARSLEKNLYFLQKQTMFAVRMGSA